MSNSNLEPVDLSELTLEQKFELRAFEARTANLSREQLAELCTKIYGQMLCRDAIYRELIKKKWGLNDGKPE